MEGQCGDRCLLPEAAPSSWESAHPTGILAGEGVLTMGVPLRVRWWPGRPSEMAPELSPTTFFHRGTKFLSFLKRKEEKKRKKQAGMF